MPEKLRFGNGRRRHRHRSRRANGTATAAAAAAAEAAKVKNWTQHHYTASRSWNQGAPDAKELCTNVLNAETPTAHSQSH
jgi:hypothetical protein